MSASYKPNAANDPTPSESDPDCHFCQRMADPGPLRDRLVFEDGFFHVSHRLEENGPSYLGILLIQTKRHARGMAELTNLEGQELGSLIQQTSRALKSCTSAAWTYVFSFTEGFRHVHVVVAARYPNMPKQYVRLSISDWPDAPKGGRPEVVALSQRLRESMLSSQRDTVPST
jgi:diadenosine tetraphosphate (Ap4A) HIT family hydrolase